MANESRKLLTVITESALEPHICRDVQELGAKGYTVSDARGSGSRGIREAGWSSSANIRIEVLCDADTAERIAAHLRARYYDDYAMVLFMHDVEVLRPAKFSGR